MDCLKISMSGPKTRPDGLRRDPVFDDRSVHLHTKMPPMFALVKKCRGLAKGSSVPNLQKFGRFTRQQAKICQAEEPIECQHP